MFQYYIYALLIAVIYRRLEIALFNPPFSPAANFDPIVYLWYAVGGIAAYIIARSLVKTVCANGLPKCNSRSALTLSILLLLWISIAANIDLSFFINKQIEQTSDWFVWYALNLGMLLPVILISAVLITLFFRFITKPVAQPKRNPFFFLLLFCPVLFVAGESFVYNKFFTKDIRLSRADLPNVVLLTIDTLRKDHLSLYGYGRETTPNIDSFFKNTTIFDRCIAAVPETAPNYTSIYTGCYPYKHIVFANGQKFPEQDANLVTLAQELSANGFYTSSHLTGPIPGTFSSLGAGVTDLYQHGVLVESTRGYELITIFLNLHNFLDSFIIDRRLHPRHYNTETQNASAWLDKRPQEPFYTHIFWHWPHHPYGDRPVDLPDEFLDNPDFQYEPLADTSLVKSKEILATRFNYDSDIYYIDIQVGAILKALEFNGCLNNTIVVFTADHGEDLGQRNDNFEPYTGHSKWLYQSSTEVPLMFFLPGQKNKSAGIIDFPVSSIDIAPTIMELTGDAIPGRMEGINILTHEGKFNQSLIDIRPFVFSFNVYFDYAPLHDDISGIFTGEYNYYHNHRNGNRELYYFPSDKHEENDLLKTDPDTADSLAVLLDRWIIEHNYNPDDIRKTSADAQSLSPAALKNLKALGYVK